MPEIIYIAGVMPKAPESWRGRALSPEDLAELRQQIERIDSISEIDPEMRGIVERNWPELASKLPPK